MRTNTFRVSQLAPLTGLVGVVLLLLGMILAGSGAATEYLPSAEQATSFLRNNAHELGLWDYLGGLSSIFLIWFAGSVSSALDTGDADTSRLARIAFGGGLAAGIFVAAAFALSAAAADRAVSEVGISPEQALATFDIRVSLASVALSMGLGLFIGVAGAAIIRSNRFPKWLGWLGIVLGILVASPWGFYLQIGALGWIVVMSVWMFVQGLSASAREQVSRMEPA